MPKFDVRILCVLKTTCATKNDHAQQCLDLECLDLGLQTQVDRVSSNNDTRAPTIVLESSDYLPCNAHSCNFHELSEHNIH